MELTNEQLAAVILATSRGLRALDAEHDRAIMDWSLTESGDDNPPYVARTVALRANVTAGLRAMRDELKRRHASDTHSAAVPLASVLPRVEVTPCE